MLRIIFTLCAFVYFTDALSCLPCRQAPCETPTCCSSGKLTLDACGCCQVCAKAQNETCGGPWDTSGHCATGLNCLKQCECKATVFLPSNGGPALTKEKECIFPFTYRGKTYNQCTRDHALSKGRAWCATKVDARGNVNDVNRADCNMGCPGTEYECKETDLFQHEGRCIDRRKIEQTLVQSAAKIYKIEENLTENNTPTRTCTDSKDGKRCTCTKVQRPGKAEPGENCSKNEGSSGWCFLDNVSNPEYPSENCFEDTYWSAVNGKFYSNLACEKTVRPKPTQRSPIVIQQSPPAVTQPTPWQGIGSPIAFPSQELPSGQKPPVSGCKSINGENCIFPFKYRGVTYNECTNVNSENGRFWCANIVNQRTREVPKGKWSDCNIGCPGMENPQQPIKPGGSKNSGGWNLFEKLING